MGAAGGRLAWLLAAVAAAHGAAAAATLSVAPGQSIQAAIDRAAPGDIVEVQRARYMENLRIEKTLTLRGIERPTVDGGGKGNTILVTAPDVTIEGIIVANSGDDRVAQNAGIYIYPGAHRAKVQHCYLSYNLFGLWIEKADDVQILHNNITGKRDYDSPRRGNGVQLYNTKGARIIGNEVSFVRDALYIDVSHH
ncbi:MAG: right-handed parallel beta-helix repeat-containing protein, partial [Ottowia sp.]|nr:right-handed parallel beta-helix repeat-containing protein [Ottowia sp.]